MAKISKRAHYQDTLGKCSQENGRAANTSTRLRIHTVLQAKGRAAHRNYGRAVGAKSYIWSLYQWSSPMQNAHHDVEPDEGDVQNMDIHIGYLLASLVVVDICVFCGPCCW